MSPMVKVRVGDADHFVDAAVAREIEYLRGTATALTAMRDGAVQPPAAQSVVDAQTSLRLAARDAMRADEARRTDPSTPRGRYIEYLTNAHRNPNG